MWTNKDWPKDIWVFRKRIESFGKIYIYWNQVKNNNQINWPPPPTKNSLISLDFQIFLQEILGSHIKVKTHYKGEFSLLKRFLPKPTPGQSWRFINFTTFRFPLSEKHLEYYFRKIWFYLKSSDIWITKMVLLEKNYFAFFRLLDYWLKVGSVAAA